MGTQLERTIANPPIVENMSKAYSIKSYSVDGMQLTAVYDLFRKVKQEVIDLGEPVMIEAICYRYKGHSISDAATYRTKEELDRIKELDPIEHFKNLLKECGGFTDEEFEMRSNVQKERVIKAIQEAEQAPFPSIDTLEEGVIVE
jgi:pyruvate dehydrogenase E1 component alpha subunit